MTPQEELEDLLRSERTAEVMLQTDEAEALRLAELIKNTSAAITRRQAEIDRMLLSSIVTLSMYRIYVNEIIRNQKSLATLRTQDAIRQKQKDSFLQNLPLWRARIKILQLKLEMGVVLEFPLEKVSR